MVQQQMQGQPVMAGQQMIGQPYVMQQPMSAGQQMQGQPMMMQGQPMMMQGQPMQGQAMLGQPMMVEGQAVNQQQIVIQQQIVYDIPPEQRCHFEGCEEFGEFHCNYSMCMYTTCRKRMCMKHRAKMCCVWGEKGQPEPQVCLKCEKSAKWRNNCFTAFFVTFFISICSCVLGPLIVGTIAGAFK